MSLLLPQPLGLSVGIIISFLHEALCIGMLASLSLLPSEWQLNAMSQPTRQQQQQEQRWDPNGRKSFGGGSGGGGGGDEGGGDDAGVSQGSSLTAPRSLRGELYHGYSWVKMREDGRGVAHCCTRRSHPSVTL